MTIDFSDSTPLKYRPDIDGLRAIAVLAVVAFHAFPEQLKGGFVGVDVFFVISGFLISQIILDGLGRGEFSFVDFYARRVRRIFPALIVVLVSCLAFGWCALLADELNQLGLHVASGAGFVMNLVLWSEAGYFDKSAEMKPLLHLWSLGVEEQFYILWPLVLWWVWRLRFSWFFLVFWVTLASFLFSVIEVGLEPVATFYSPITRFWELLSGTWLALFFRYRHGLPVGRTGPVVAFIGDLFRGRSGRWFQYRPQMASALGLLLLGWAFWGFDKDLSFPGGWALVPVLGAVLIIGAGPQAWVNRVVLSSRVLVWFGLISFPLYLWHWPILSFGRIVYIEVPPPEFKAWAVLLAVLLAWLTVKWVEKPLRFGHGQLQGKVRLLSAAVIGVGAVGCVVSQVDFSDSHAFDQLLVKRKGGYVVGSSLTWYRGKNDWLFLGNACDSTVAKLQLLTVPSVEEIKKVKAVFSEVAAAGAQQGIKVALMMAPNKSSIYPEYLPDDLVPSAKRYSSFFLDELKHVPHLQVYDPTNDLLSLKAAEGILYWMTDTHWNQKGAFLAYAGLLKSLQVPIPEVEFYTGLPHRGDLIGLSRLKNLPLHAQDNWEVRWPKQPVWTEVVSDHEKSTVFGSVSVVRNQKPISNKSVWVLGDSFTHVLRPYLNATFREVRYVGHWADKLGDLPYELNKVDQKPDIIFIIRVERSF